MKLVLTVLALKLVIGPSSAQQFSFICDFTTECSRDTRCEEKDMKLTFLFNEKSSEAYMQGNVDLVQVMPLRGDSAISFAEPLGTGAIQTTTILNDGTAIHSRHTIISDEVVPAQWYGHCDRFGG